ncbi:MAG: PEP-CTERM sorting domain-containing protein, partial [Planctomycetales bacterium]|nr:PEP-CTERM sorting domain-containing protein [Planctomycetales bacterium]
GVPVTLGGTLSLEIDDVSWPDLVGTSFQLFEWHGVTPSGSFDAVVVQAGTEWDTGNLYTTGEVTLIAAVPEPTALALLGFASTLVAVVGRYRN